MWIDKFVWSKRWRTACGQPHTTRTDKSLKTEGPKILSNFNDIFYFRTVIIGGPIIVLYYLSSESVYRNLDMLSMSVSIAQAGNFSDLSAILRPFLCSVYSMVKWIWEYKFVKLPLVPTDVSLHKNEPKFQRKTISYGNLFVIINRSSWSGIKFSIKLRHNHAAVK